MIFLLLLCTRKRKEMGCLSRGVCKGSQEFFESFLKKYFKKFGRIKNLPYLCTRFRLENLRWMK